MQLECLWHINFLVDAILMFFNHVSTIFMENDHFERILIDRWWNSQDVEVGRCDMIGV